MRIGSWGKHLGRQGGVLLASLLVSVAALAQDIVVGQIGPFTGMPSPEAKEVNEGIRAHFAQVNARGGVNGRKVAFFELDDQYDADRFVQRFQEAMQRKPVALLSPVGSKSIKRLLDDKLLDAANVVVLNAVPGAESLRTPGHPRLFHIRAGDREQIEKVVRHAHSLGITRLGVMYHDIPLGLSGLATAKAAAAQDGTVQITAAQSGADAASQAQAAGRIAAADVQSVLVIGAPRYSADAIAQLRKAGVTKMLFTLSYMPARLAAQVAGEGGARGVGIAQVYPHPMGVSLALQREFRAAMKAAHPALADYSFSQLEGYLTARLLTEVLQRSREVSAEALARALHAQPWDLGGFVVDFRKGNVGSRYVDIGVMKADGRLMY